MNNATPSHNLPLDIRRKRALYRASYRGTKEMDFIFGRFAQVELPGMSEAELDRFEHLLDASDTDLYNWFSGRTPVPAAYDNDMFRRLAAFHAMPQGE